MFNIDNIKIKYPLILAPMAGVTDSPFRTICKKMCASLMYTEFVSAEGIIRESVKTLDMIRFKEYERPLGVQIFGDNPDVVGKSAKYIYEKFKPDLIDINFGCPVPKITNKGAGSGALKDMTLMKKIVKKVIEHSNNIPITVKMRAGWDKNCIISTDAGMMLEDIGVKAITLLPMFPHSLNARPLLVNEDSEIMINICSKGKTDISLDSHNESKLRQGDSISLSKAKSKLTLIHPKDHDFYSACRKKLGWSLGLPY